MLCFSCGLTLLQVTHAAFGALPSTHHKPYLPALLQTRQSSPSGREHSFLFASPAEAEESIRDATDQVPSRERIRELCKLVAQHDPDWVDRYVLNTVPTLDPSLQSTVDKARKEAAARPPPQPVGVDATPIAKEKEIDIQQKTQETTPSRSRRILDALDDFSNIELPLVSGSKPQFNSCSVAEEKDTPKEDAPLQSTPKDDQIKLGKSVSSQVTAQTETTVSDNRSGTIPSSQGKSPESGSIAGEKVKVQTDNSSTNATATAAKEKSAGTTTFNATMSEKSQQPDLPMPNAPKEAAKGQTRAASFETGTDETVAPIASKNTTSQSIPKHVVVTAKEEKLQVPMSKPQVRDQKVTPELQTTPVNQTAVDEKRVSLENKESAQDALPLRTNPQSANDDTETDDLTVLFRSTGTVKWKSCPFSVLQKLGYTRREIVAMDPDALSLIVEEELPKPRSGIPARWKSEDASDRVKVIPKESAAKPFNAGKSVDLDPVDDPSSTKDDEVANIPAASAENKTSFSSIGKAGLSEPNGVKGSPLPKQSERPSRGPDPQESAAKMFKENPTRSKDIPKDTADVGAKELASNRTPRSPSTGRDGDKRKRTTDRVRKEEFREKRRRQRTAEAGRKVYTGRPQESAKKRRRDDPPPPPGFWPDIDSFRKMLRDEAGMRLSILGDGFADTVKDESEWRLELYKNWLWTLHNGVGKPIVESRSDRMRRMDRERSVSTKKSTKEASKPDRRQSRKKKKARKRRPTEYD